MMTSPQATAVANDVRALTIPEAVRRYGVGRSTLYKLMGDGSLPARKVGKRTLIPVADLEAWFASLPGARIKRAA